MNEYKTQGYDVLVVGAGAAGLRAAIEAATQGARTAVVCKSLLGKAGTAMDSSGVAAALASTAGLHHWRAHCVDTLLGGQLLGDWRMARIHAKEAPARVQELEAWGAIFKRTADGRILLAPSNGHSLERVAQGAGRVGLEVLRTLQFRAVQMGIDIHMECAIQRLLTRAGGICGALGYRRGTGDVVLFACKAVVLATGSGGRAWGSADAPADCTGDGAALALNVGADLMDMEFAGSGGIRVDAESAETAIRGLFAAGDTAAGLHGAGAIVGNRLSGALVFGCRAGAHAASHAVGCGQRAMDAEQIDVHVRAMIAPLQRHSGANPYSLCRGLQECMSDIVGNARSAADLQEALARVRRIGRRAAEAIALGPRQYNPAWHLVHELGSMVVFSEAVILSALARVVSGSAQNLIVRHAGQGLAVHPIQRPALPGELQRLIDRRVGWQTAKLPSESGAATPAAAGSKNIG